MKKIEPTEMPLPVPPSGGSWVQDPLTGELVKAGQQQGGLAKVEVTDAVVPTGAVNVILKADQQLDKQAVVSEKEKK